MQRLSNASSAVFWRVRVEGRHGSFAVLELQGGSPAMLCASGEGQRDPTFSLCGGVEGVESIARVLKESERVLLYQVVGHGECVNQLCGSGLEQIHSLAATADKQRMHVRDILHCSCEQNIAF